VNTVYDRNSINNMLHSSNGMTGREITRRGERVLARAKELVGYDSGRLHNSLRLSRSTVGGEVAVTISTPLKYARYHHDGTGIFGRTGQPIRPVSAKALRFKPRGSTGFVFAASVRGSRPNPFMREALEAAADPGLIARARSLLGRLAGRNGAPAAGIRAGRDAAKIPGAGPRPARTPSPRRRAAPRQGNGGWQRNVSGGRSAARDTGWERGVGPGPRRRRND
jgi:hypothetical protein